MHYIDYYLHAYNTTHTRETAKPLESQVIIVKRDLWGDKLSPLLINIPDMGPRSRMGREGLTGIG